MPRIEPVKARRGVVPGVPSTKATQIRSTAAGPRPSRRVWSMPCFRPRGRLSDEHRFRSLGKLVVGNLDRVADVDNVGN